MNRAALLGSVMALLAGDGVGHVTAGVSAPGPSTLFKPRYQRRGENWPGQRSAYLVGAWRGDAESYSRETRQLRRGIERAERKERKKEEAERRRLRLSR
jgi:hypothetical protein